MLDTLLKKTKKRPEDSRIKVIVQTAIKDGIIDVIRDYRYKFIKNLKVLVNNVNKNIKILDLLLDIK